MQTVSRRVFLRIVGIGTAAFTLGACAATPAATPVTTPAAKVQESPSATEKPAPSPAPTGRIKVRLGDPGQPGTQYHFEEVYDQAFPEYEIIREYTPWSEYHDKLMTEIAAGTAPDLTFVGFSFFRETAEKGIFMDLGPFIESDPDFDAKGFTVPVDVGGALKGTIYLIQQCLSDPPGLVYNVDAFEEAGIPLPPVAGEPNHDTAKWADLLEWAEKLTKRDSSGKVERFGISSPYTNLSYCAMYWFQAGGDIFDKQDQIDPTRCTINSPECVEAFQFMVDMVNKYHVAPTSTESEALGTGDQQWYSGRVAMFHRWWHFDSAKTDKFRWRGMHIPWQKRKASYNLYSNGWTIPVSSTQKQAAWKIIVGCTTWDIFLRQQIRCNRPAYHTEYWISQMPPEQQAYEREMFSRYDPNDLSNQTPLMCPNRGRRQIADILVAEIQAMYLGAKTVQEALETAAQKANEVLAELVKA